MGWIVVVGKAFSELGAALLSASKMAQSVNAGVCDLGEAASALKAASLTMGRMAKSAEEIAIAAEQFIAEVARIDGEVAGLIDRRKGKFYEGHPHLMPDSEMGLWDRLVSAVGSAGEWCGKHWKCLATVAIGIIISFLVLSGVGSPLVTFMLMAANKGFLAGGLLGGFLGGLSSWAAGGSFDDGFELGFVNGALSGSLLGMLGASSALLGFTIAPLLTCRQKDLLTVASGFSSLAYLIPPSTRS